MFLHSTSCSLPRVANYPEQLPSPSLPFLSTLHHPMVYPFNKSIRNFFKMQKYHFLDAILYLALFHSVHSVLVLQYITLQLESMWMCFSDFRSFTPSYPLEKTGFFFVFFCFCRSLFDSLLDDCQIFGHHGCCLFLYPWPLMREDL